MKRYSAIAMTDETKTKLRSPICERPFEAEQKIQIHNCLGRLVRTLGLLCFYIGGVWSIDTFGNRFERVFLRINTHYYDPILRKHSHIIKSILDSLSSSYSLNSAIWYSSRERYACSLKNYPNPQALRLQNKMKKTQKVFWRKRAKAEQHTTQEARAHNIRKDCRKGIRKFKPDDESAIEKRLCESWNHFNFRRTTCH